jgi:hypothetical protein
MTSACVGRNASVIAPEQPLEAEPVAERQQGECYPVILTRPLRPRRQGGVTGLCGTAALVSHSSHRIAVAARHPAAQPRGYAPDPHRRGWRRGAAPSHQLGPSPRSRRARVIGYSRFLAALEDGRAAVAEGRHRRHPLARMVCHSSHPSPCRVRWGDSTPIGSSPGPHTGADPATPTAVGYGGISGGGNHGAAAVECPGQHCGSMDG